MSLRPGLDAGHPREFGKLPDDAEVVGRLSANQLKGKLLLTTGGMIYR